MNKTASWEGTRSLSCSLTDSQKEKKRMLMVGQYEPPAPCQSVRVGAGRGREHGADLWPRGPTADRSDPPERTGKSKIRTFLLYVKSRMWMCLCACFPSQSHFSRAFFRLVFVHSCGSCGTAFPNGEKRKNNRCWTRTGPFQTTTSKSALLAKMYTRNYMQIFALSHEDPVPRSSVRQPCT